MRNHWHTGVDAALFAGLSALVVFHLIRFVAAQLAGHPNGVAHTLGLSLGGLVTFGS